ncbi:MAG: hypothetical protein ACKV2V_05505 [Blastocatellia bacterium]
MGFTRNHGRAILLTLGLIALIFALLAWRQSRQPLSQARTLAGAGPQVKTDSLGDPFGVAADSKGGFYVSDGAGGRIFHVQPLNGLGPLSALWAKLSLGSGGQNEAQTTLVAEGLEMPSALALADDNQLIVANTGAHTIVRIDLQNGAQSIVAGAKGKHGFADGPAARALFDGPVGLALGPDGAVYVADTYNDRIRKISADGQVTTIAGGGAPGFQDGRGPEAAFDTPCGVALAPDGSLLVADTGNHRIRRLTPDGVVTTIAGTGEEGERDGPPNQAAFAEPMAIAVRNDTTFYVADAGGNSLRLCDVGENPAVTTLAGGWPPGARDGAFADGVRVNGPIGLALTPGWWHRALVFADSGNGLLRALTTDGAEYGKQTQSLTPPTAADIRKFVPPRWPYDPPEARRDIAGTFGEIRGERMPEHDTWFHNGLDIPGAYGETVRAIHTERVTRPLSVEDVGSPRERMRLPLLGYIHMRIGRDQADNPLGIPGVSFRRDAAGAITGVRVRRGTLFRAGDPLGTLNRLNHVHLIAGVPGGEVNALAALRFPGISDSIAPIIESVRITDEHFQTLPELAPAGAVKSYALPDAPAKLRVVVRAYDQADGNPSYRRLGVFKVGYALLDENGAPLPGYEKPRETMVFEKLPLDPGGPAFVYAEGSQSGYTDKTIFDYIATNQVRDGAAREAFLDTAALSGRRQCVVRVFVEDFFGNRTQRDLILHATENK